MEEDIRSFLDYLAREKRYSPNTLAAYNSDLNQLAAYAKFEGPRGGRDPSGVALNAGLLSGYIRNLKERNYTASTIARKIAAAKSLLTAPMQGPRQRWM